MKKPTGDTLVYLNDIRETAKLLIDDVERIEAQLDEVKSPATFEKRIDDLASVVFQAHLDLSGRSKRGF